MHPDSRGDADACATPTIRASDAGAVVVDPVERRRMQLRTPAPVDPESVDGGAFPVPVDAAASLDAASVTVPYGVHTCVRAPDGALRRTVEDAGTASLPADDHVVELSGQVKVYLRVRAPVEITVAPDRTTVAFDGEATVVVGARSYHSRPAATVTTTTDPGDVAAAVSTFGSALKTLSPERAFPTLRGHPPRVELGDELRVPDGVEPPDTDVTVTVPASRRAAFVATPLAYYLGATVEVGDPPRIVAGGVEHHLDRPRFEVGVERALERAFLLDCVARTDGWFRTPLVERDAVEPHVDRDLDALSTASPAERVDAALALSFDAVADAVPEWPLVAYVADDADVAALPHLAHELAVVRTPPDRGPVVDADAAPVDVAGFARAADGGHLPRPRVDPPPADAVAQTWVGDGTPLRGGKFLAAAHENRLARDPDDGDLSVAVVCNDDQMAGEYHPRLYRGRDDVPLDVTVHRNCTVAELRGVLAEDASFLHYVGHVDPGGLVCADGRVDAATLGDVGVETFFLNGCRSYAQGVALVDAGAVGGIATVSDVADDDAAALGRTVARLLDAGFPLRSALAVAEPDPGRYVTVGDAGTAVAQPESGVPNVTRVRTLADDAARVTVETHPTRAMGVGSVFTAYTDDADEATLVGGDVDVVLSADELRELLAMEETPFVVDGDLAWPSDVDVDALFAESNF